MQIAPQIRRFFCNGAAGLADDALWLRGTEVDLFKLQESNDKLISEFQKTAEWWLRSYYIGR
jgi:hypothetical protein